MACIIVTLYFFGIPPLKARPNILPTIIAMVFTIVPNKLNLLENSLNLFA